jgi:TPR repeat protein
MAVVTSSLELFAAGCANPPAASPSAGYEEQACVEHALRGDPDPGAVATARIAFERSCDERHAAACSALGVIHEIGLGVPADPTRAAALYERACGYGNVRGCTNLAITRIRGFGAPREVRFGARLLGAMCEHGDARACLHLARLHDAGEGTSRDRALAARLFELACEGQEASACLERAETLANAGRHRDAAAFYGKACAFGDTRACDMPP